MTKKTPIVVLIALMACMLAMAGCAGHGTLTSDIDDATGTYTVTAQDAPKGSGVGSLSGGIEVAEGQSVVADVNLEKGSLQMRLLDANGQVVVDDTASGVATVSHDLEPGDYSIGVSCNEDGTTGTLEVKAK